METKMCHSSFVRVVYWRPSRYKVARSRGGVTNKVSNDAILISLHDAVQQPGQASLTVDSSALHSRTCVSPVMVLRRCGLVLGTHPSTSSCLAGKLKPPTNTLYLTVFKGKWVLVLLLQYHILWSERLGMRAQPACRIPKS